jgi:hypothetical protein
MGKHATNVDKAIFLTYLLYIYQAKAAQKAKLAKLTAIDIKMLQLMCKSSTTRRGYLYLRSKSK